MTSWAPATEAETAMRDALRSGDQERYFRVLARTELLLPLSAEAMTGREPMGWGTWTSGGRTHVLAFTSTEAMRSCLAQHAGSARKVAYHELAQTWPNLQWWLAVNPGLPIEGYLPAWFIGQLAHGDTRLPGPVGGPRERPERIDQVQALVARARATASVPLRPVPGQPAEASARPAMFAPAGPATPPGWPAASVPGNLAPAVPGPPVPAPAVAPAVPAPPVPAPAVAPAVPAAVPPAPGVPGPAGLPRRIPAASGLGGNGPSRAIKDAFGHRTARRTPAPPAQTDRAEAPPQAAPSSAPTSLDTAAAPAPADSDPPPANMTSALAALAPSAPAASTPASAPPETPSPSEALSPSEAPSPPEALSLAVAPSPMEAEAADQSESSTPAFTPANSVESSLVKAAEDGSTDSFLSTLLLAKVLLPLPAGAKENIRPGDPTFLWRTEIVDDQVYVVLFTSPERMAEFFTEPITSIEVKFLRLIKAWPGVSWSFAVNPGSSVGAKLPGAQIVALASWAADVGLTADSGEEPAPAPQAGRPVQEERRKHTVMQKPVPASKIDFYLERGYDRVCGFVHRANEVAHLRTPAELRAALGLSYPGSPFGMDDVVYVLRWPAYRPSLYRIPYGGQTEAAMRAMEGWVIQRAPFRGNGFAPGESADVIAEFKVDSLRLPHGAQLWRVRVDAPEEMVAVLDADGPRWRRVGDG